MKILSIKSDISEDFIPTKKITFMIDMENFMDARIMLGDEYPYVFGKELLTQIDHFGK